MGNCVNIELKCGVYPSEKHDFLKIPLVLKHKINGFQLKGGGSNGLGLDHSGSQPFISFFNFLGHNMVYIQSVLYTKQFYLIISLGTTTEHAV